MRALVLFTSLLVIALVHALMLVPRAEPMHVTTTEEIRTSHGQHHHKTMASWTDDTNDSDDDDDSDDDVLASTTPVAIAPMTLRPHAQIVFVDDDALGPSSTHARLLDRPPRG